MPTKLFVVKMTKKGCDKVFYVARCPVGGFVDSWDLRSSEAHQFCAETPEAAASLARKTKLKEEFDTFIAIPVK